MSASASPARSSSSALPTPAQHLGDPSSVDRVSLSPPPSHSYKSFFYALLGFTVLSVALGGAYEYYHQSQRAQQQKRRGKDPGSRPPEI